MKKKDNPHYMRDWSKKRRKERKEKALNFLGNKCIKCGSIEKLEFDHKDRKTKRTNFTEMLHYSEKAFWEELNKCQLLCHNCHVDKSRNDGSWQKIKPIKHGTLYGYINRKCRCKLCKLRKRNYEKTRRVSFDK